jgi:hypothetical protein
MTEGELLIMLRWKKNILMLIAGVMITAAAAGCGTYAAETETGQESNSAATAETGTGLENKSAATETETGQESSSAATAEAVVGQDSASAATADAASAPSAEDARVSYLGPEGTYTEEAAQFFFPEASAMLPETTVLEAIADVVEGKSDYAVIPQENTLGGAVTNYVDALIAEEKVFVVGEVVLPINQTLMGVPGATLEDIQLVCSHAQGLKQSETWRKEHLPEAVEVTHVMIDKEAEGAIFGLLVMTTEMLARDVVIVSSLALTALCLICTIFSKRTLYPWLISVLTLCLPIVMYYLNTYPM